MEVKTQVRQFVCQNFYVADPASFGDDTSFLDRGIVDSTAILEVVAFLEERFQIKVDDADFVPENLDSLDRIAAFVNRKREARGEEGGAVREAGGITRAG